MAAKFPIGELFMLGFRGKIIPPWLTEFAQKYGLGGVVLFDYDCTTKEYRNNIENAQQVRELCSTIHELPSSPLIFIDQEGGKVRRLKESYGFKPLPSAKNFNFLSAEEKRNFVFESLNEQKELGIDFDLSPVIDLNTNPNNPDIGAVERSFSDKPEDIVENVRIWNECAQQTKIGLCLKHYPGIGESTKNSHLDLMEIQKVSEIQENLFFKLTETLSGNAILLSHALVNEWDREFPVSISAKAIQRIRSKNKETLLITDDLQMQGLLKRIPMPKACLKGLQAGVDMLLIGNNLLGEQKDIFDIVENILQSMEKDKELETNCHASLQRVSQRKKMFI